MLHLALPLLSGALVLPAAIQRPERIDFAERYPATLEWSESGLPWTSEATDVFGLERFAFTRGRDLVIESGPANVVFGRHGTNVLWAALFPDEPARVRSKDPKTDERAAELFIRFAPSDVGELFPAKTVRGAGDAALRARAARLFGGKIAWRWCTGEGGNTTVVQPDNVIFDFDAASGVRRLFHVERRAVTYVADFEQRPLRPLVPIEPERAFAIFDAVWSAFAGEYAGFVRHPELDWEAHGRTLAERARRAPTTLDLGGVLADGLAVLEDLHVWVSVGGVHVPGFHRERPKNGNWDAVEAALGGVQRLGGNVAFGRTPDGIGYVAVSGLSDRDAPEHFDQALETLAGTWALVVDLRFNGGGDETLAQRMAGRFLEDEVTYAKNRYRNGPKSHDLGPLLERRVGPRGPWRYGAPVWVLQGPLTMSSAESFVQMLACAPNATTMGANTAGSSGNPRRLELEGGIVVNLPRWLDLDLDERPIEGVGLPPAERLEFPVKDFEKADPLLEALLARLRRTPAKERVPGRR